MWMKCCLLACRQWESGRRVNGGSTWLAVFRVGSELRQCSEVSRAWMAAGTDCLYVRCPTPFSKPPFSVRVRACAPPCLLQPVQLSVLGRAAQAAAHSTD